MSSEITKPDPILSSLSGKRIITDAERVEIEQYYARSSERARNAMVSSFLLQGFTVDRMAKLLRIDPQIVANHYEEAAKEVRGELQVVPEGQLLMSQVVIEGYARYQQFVLSTVIRGCRKLSSKSAYREVPQLIRAGLETLNSVTEKMEKYGMLPTGESKRSGRETRGGIRISGNGIDENKSFDSEMDRIAKKAGVSIDQLEKEIIEGSVQ